MVTGVSPGEVQDVSAGRGINVYGPSSAKPTSGCLLCVPESELIPVSMSVDEAMKMMFSGGMYTPRVAEAVGAGAGWKRGAGAGPSLPPRGNESGDGPRLPRCWLPEAGGPLGCTRGVMGGVWPTGAFP